MEYRDSSSTVKNVAGFVLIGGMLSLSLMRSCSNVFSNHDTIDTEKNFNVAVDANGENVSVTYISSYSDYQGVQVQFTTFDGLIVLTSTRDTHFLKDMELKYLNEYATMLASGENPKITSYDELEGTDYSFYDGWNKKFIEFQYNFDHALIEDEDGNIIIAEINSWKDWSEDDKIQLEFSNGLLVLRDIDKVKLVNTSSASEDSLYNYALSLVGDANKIKYYSQVKTLEKKSSF